MDSSAPQAARAGDTIEIGLPVGQQLAHGFGIACCVFLALSPMVFTGRLLPYPVLQIGAGLIALAGLAIARGIFGRVRLTVGPRGFEIASPALRCDWSEIELSQISTVKAPTRTALVGAPRWQAHLELYPRDPDALLRAQPGARSLVPRRQPEVLRLSLRERRDTAAAVDAAFIRYGRPGYQGIVGDDV